MLVRIFCMLLVMCGSVPVAAQQLSRYALGYRQGYLLTHHEELTDAYGGLTPSAVDFIWLRQTNGKKDWQRTWNYPDIGMSFSWIDLKDPELGQTFYTTVFLQKYIGNRGNDLQFSFKVAPGFAYSTETYEQVDNENNTFISSHFNMVMEGNFLAHYRLTPEWHTYGGVQFTHYSNGGVKTPNSGFNIPSLTMGIIYSPGTTTFERNHEPVDEIEDKFSTYLMYAGSVKSAGDNTNEVGFAWTFSGYGHWRLNQKSALTAGVDVFYNSTIRERLDDPEANQYRVALQAGHDLIAGPTSLLFQLGYYVYRPEDVDKSFYWRLGIKQQMGKKLFAGIFLKAHMGKADVIEWGLGYRF